VSVVAVGLLAAKPARASCAAPAPAIVWSYPADGQTDVPTNARVFVLPNLGAFGAEVTFNGQSADKPIEDDRFGYAPQLEPYTRYVVGVSSDPTLPPVTFSFTTGAGPGPDDPPPPLSISGVTQTPVRALSPLCAQAVAAMDCFDTGQSTHVVFETTAQPVAFFVGQIDGNSIPWSMTWPGECGSPEVFVTSCMGSYRVYAVGATGLATTADATCPPPAAMPMPNQAPSGCQVAPGAHGMSPLGLLVCALSVLARGARRRRPASPQSAGMRAT
jgi:hypothetical protein